MRSLLVNKNIIALICLIVVSAVGLNAQIPQRPSPPRLVNDLAGVFDPAQVSAMENSLELFAKKTSNQIVVVTVPELYGMDKSELAFEIGIKWGVGQSKFNNGVVILVKPKEVDSKGDLYIATGYGLEGVLTDAVCRRIIEEYMIPSFRENNYYEGVEQALKIIYPLVEGEISSDEFAKNDDTGGIVAVVFFLLFIVFVAIAISRGSKNGPKNMGGGRGKNINAVDAFLLGSLLSGSGRHGSFGGGSFGGGGGGFGGFGGGSFGGGGAGGSW
jgi:uncharacterized protein